MKYALLITIQMMASSLLLAQTDSTIVDVNVESDGTVIKIGIDLDESEFDTSPDTTRIQIGNKMVTIVTMGDEDIKMIEEEDSKESWDDKEQKASLTWWDGMDLGVNTLMNENYEFDINGEFDFLNPRVQNSRYISFNFASVKLRLIKDYVGLTSGLTFQSYSFKYGGSNQFALGDSLFAFDSGERTLNKNKIRADYFGIPLLLEINTSLDPKRSFHITAGVVGKMRIGGVYKLKGEVDGDRFKEKSKGDLGFNRWGLDAMLRVGYGWFTVFGQVGLEPLLSSANAPDVYAFAAGIAFTINDD